MNEFVLVIIVTMGLGNHIHLRLEPKETFKTYEFPYKEIHKVISVKTRCEKVIGNPKQLNKGKSI